MALGNRNSQHSFAQIPSVNMARSQFNRSFGIKKTMDFDFLTPVFVDEILPGDTANVKLHSFARLATQVVPVMDNMYIDFYYFFVPNRLVWENWERFNGAQDDPDDSTDFVIPTITSPTSLPTGFENGSIYDHFGLPTEVPGLEVNVLPLRCYNLIYNEWFRDQNLVNRRTVNKGDGPDTYITYTLQRAAKAHDYFTSALPWPQKGPAIEMPLGTVAPVLTNNLSFNITGGSVSNANVFLPNSSAVLTSGFTNTGALAPIRFGTESGLYADLSSATAATINQLRQAFSVQSLYELDARGGTRYTEILLSHFNVTSPDFRLQRPEYLGGGRQAINVHPVPQTSASDGGTPQANLASYATSASSGSIGFTKSFVEHGYVIGLARARADITYQQGLERMWSRQTRFDFFWPKLQEIGEQAILNKELYAQGSVNLAADDAVFGYQERYAEYRYKPSQIQGQFRSNFAQSLDTWHLGEDFATLPVLGEVFISSNTPIERALAVTNAPHLLVDMFYEYKHARPMMTYSMPSTLGRF